MTVANWTKNKFILGLRNWIQNFGRTKKCPHGTKCFLVFVSLLWSNNFNHFFNLKKVRAFRFKCSKIWNHLLYGKGATMVSNLWFSFTVKLVINSIFFDCNRNSIIGLLIKQKVRCMTKNSITNENLDYLGKFHYLTKIRQNFYFCQKFDKIFIFVKNSTKFLFLSKIRQNFYFCSKSDFWSKFRFLI